MKIRIIGVINILNNIAVQSINFKFFLPIGKPKIVIDYLYSWGIDEIVILNISRKKNNLKTFPKLIKDCFIPITAGGGISSIKDVDFLIKNGADKILINTNVSQDPQLLRDISKKYGNQALVVSIDVKKIRNKYVVFINSGNTKSKINLEQTIKLAENCGAGEILINSIDRDGSQKGFDKNLFALIKKYTNLPFNICGGAGKKIHFEEIIPLKPSAICAANFFHFKEQRVRVLKNYLSLSKNKKKIRIVN